MRPPSRSHRSGWAAAGLFRCWRRQPDAEAAPTDELDEPFDEPLSDEADFLLAESLLESLVESLPVLDEDEPDDDEPDEGRLSFR